ncbi:DUF4142 domain-containing protein [Nonomuraea sp. NPDC049309]|uniref:DUF4142 domain-containing protein n=1 Tax=Nonomuraea sp. NPDC049309 TaxID=3364350 RepID=UPI0037236295
MRARLTLSLAVITLAVLPGCAGQQPPYTAAVPAPPSDAGAEVSEQDREWMRLIHQANLAEVQAGRLAQGKATTKQIKKVGETLVKDHTQLDTKVTKTAEQLGIDLPTSQSKEQREMLDRIQSASGQDFDQDFVSGMIKAHRQALNATKTEISKGSAPAVVSLAKAAEPSLEKHLADLRKAQGGG